MGRMSAQNGVVDSITLALAFLWAGGSGGVGRVNRMGVVIGE